MILNFSYTYKKDEKGLLVSQLLLNHRVTALAGYRKHPKVLFSTVHTSVDY